MILYDVSDASGKFAQYPHIALAGVSTKTHKFGYKIFHFLKKAGYLTYPINPRYEDFEGQKCYHSVNELPENVKFLVIVTPADQSFLLAQDAINRNFEIVWFQPGSFDERIYHMFENSPVDAVIGDCIMVDAQFIN
jgi:uncharacterized protein